MRAFYWSKRDLQNDIPGHDLGPAVKIVETGHWPILSMQDKWTCINANVFYFKIELAIAGALKAQIMIMLFIEAHPSTLH